tara:strand:- start:41145 stop:41756 length:612 start_codon:yes stop_codon:yes gene_type:complete
MIANGYHKQMLKKIYSNEDKSLVLRVDLEKKMRVPSSKTEISIRPYKESDYKYFPDTKSDDLLLSLNMPTCYVAVTSENIPFYRQWLLQKPDKEKFRIAFGEFLPIPKDNEAMLERVYVVPEYRGKFINAQAGYLMNQKVKELGIRWIITSIYLSNTRSIRASKIVGFEPYKIQQIRYRFFKRSIVYNDLPKDFYEKFKMLKK